MSTYRSKYDFLFLTDKFFQAYDKRWKDALKECEKRQQKARNNVGLTYWRARFTYCLGQYTKAQYLLEGAIQEKNEKMEVHEAVSITLLYRDVLEKLDDNVKLIVVPDNVKKMWDWIISCKGKSTTLRGNVECQMIQAGLVSDWWGLVTKGFNVRRCQRMNDSKAFFAYIVALKVEIDEIQRRGGDKIGEVKRYITVCQAVLQRFLDEIVKATFENGKRINGITNGRELRVVLQCMEKYGEENRLIKLVNEMAKKESKVYVFSKMVDGSYDIFWSMMDVWMKAKEYEKALEFCVNKSAEIEKLQKDVKLWKYLINGAVEVKLMRQDLTQKVEQMLLGKDDEIERTKMIAKIWWKMKYEGLNIEDDIKRYLQQFKGLEASFFDMKDIVEDNGGIKMDDMKGMNDFSMINDLRIKYLLVEMGRIKYEHGKEGNEESRKKILRLAEESIKMYFETDDEYGTIKAAYGLIGMMMLWKHYQLGISLEFESWQLIQIVILGLHCTEYTVYSSEVTIMLVYVCNWIGLGRMAIQAFKLLRIKGILNESASHILCDRVTVIGGFHVSRDNIKRAKDEDETIGYGKRENMDKSFPDIRQILWESLAWIFDADEDIVRELYGKSDMFEVDGINSLVELRNCLQNSLHGIVRAINHRRLHRLYSYPEGNSESHEDIQEIIDRGSLIFNVKAGDGLTVIDNRDYSLIGNIEPDMCRKKFQENLSAFPRQNEIWIRWMLYVDNLAELIWLNRGISGLSPRLAHVKLIKSVWKDEFNNDPVFPSQRIDKLIKKIETNLDKDINSDQMNYSPFNWVEKRIIIMWTLLEPIILYSTNTLDQFIEYPVQAAQIFQDIPIICKYIKQLEIDFERILKYSHRGSSDKVHFMILSPYYFQAVHHCRELVFALQKISREIGLIYRRNKSHSHDDSSILSSMNFLKDTIKSLGQFIEDANHEWIRYYTTDSTLKISLSNALEFGPTGKLIKHHLEDSQRLTFTSQILDNLIHELSLCGIPEVS